MRTNDILHILANTADGVFAVSTDHKIVFWNKPAQKILGYSAKEVLGKFCNEIIAGTDSSGKPVCSRSCNVMKAIDKGENPENYEMLTHSKKGDAVWLNVSIICIPGSQPALNTVVHMFHDMTKPKSDLNAIRELVSDINNENKPDDIYSSNNKPKTEEILTPRERKVLKCLGAGYRPAEISDKLYISLSTLRKHIQNIHSKLEVHSMLEAVAKARQSNLI